MEEQVKKGLALLNEKLPDWKKKVDFDKVNFASHTDCLLGQVFGDFSKGLKVLNLNYCFGRPTARSHGFGCSHGEEEALLKAWREVL